METDLDHIVFGKFCSSMIWLVFMFWARLLAMAVFLLLLASLPFAIWSELVLGLPDRLSACQAALASPLSLIPILLSAPIFVFIMEFWRFSLVKVGVLVGVLALFALSPDPAQLSGRSVSAVDACSFRALVGVLAGWTAAWAGFGLVRSASQR